MWVTDVCAVNLVAGLFITPSFKFMLIGYGPAFVLAEIYLIASYGKRDSYANLTVIAMMFAVLNLGLFYAL